MRAKFRLKAQQTPESVIIGLKIEEQFTFDKTVFNVYSIKTALHCLNICKVRALLDAASMGF